MTAPMSPAAVVLWLTLTLAVGVPLLCDPLGKLLRWYREFSAAMAAARADSAAEDRRLAVPLPAEAVPVARMALPPRPLTEQQMRMRWLARLDRAARRAYVDSLGWPARLTGTDLAAAYEDAYSMTGGPQPYRPQHRAAVSR
jgi:hypothetical protein